MHRRGNALASPVVAAKVQWTHEPVVAQNKHQGTVFLLNLNFSDWEQHPYSVQILLPWRSGIAHTVFTVLLLSFLGRFPAIWRHLTEINCTCTALSLCLHGAITAYKHRDIACTFFLNDFTALPQSSHCIQGVLSSTILSERRALAFVLSKFKMNAADRRSWRLHCVTGVASAMLSLPRHSDLFPWTPRWRRSVWLKILDYRFFWKNSNNFCAVSAVRTPWQLRTSSMQTRWQHLEGARATNSWEKSEFLGVLATFWKIFQCCDSAMATPSGVTGVYGQLKNLIDQNVHILNEKVSSKYPKTICLILTFDQFSTSVFVNELPTPT